MTELIKTEIRTDINGKPYDHHYIETDIGYLDFSVEKYGHKADRGYVLFTLVQDDTVNEIKTYFGMNHTLAVEFANKILKEVKKARKKK